MHEPEPLKQAGLNAVRLGRRLFRYFSGCDYFRLARNPNVERAGIQALRSCGLNVAASRRTTGNHAIYRRLEAELERFFDAPAALVVPDGYLAPLAAAQALAPECDRVLIDEFAHGALWEAARMFGTVARKFKHRDGADLARQLAGGKSDSRPIVLTDGMFSHDGSVAPLRHYLAVLPRRGLLLVDDAHGVGLIGKSGKGSLEYEGVDRRRIIQCGTLSKAFGSYGGFILTSVARRRRIVERSRVFAGSTPLPPPLAGAALAALNILRNDSSRRQRLLKNTEYLRHALRAAGWQIENTPGPILRLPALGQREARQLKSAFLAAGIYPPYITYGTASPRGVFRIVVSSEHTRGELDQVASVLTAVKSNRRI